VVKSMSDINQHTESFATTPELTGRLSHDAG
jgi:hypothetical protein